ncbi:hypothetical protein [Dyella monticola]|uniref:hypothetical protein n=1 Tax=Dyella monticola TaxID=1927958 RepID=UPI001E4DAEBC|nr:hypothetical protein [Dyella monticola]
MPITHRERPRMQGVIDSSGQIPVKYPSGTQALGDALFARPLDGAWQTILQPTAASLNVLWRASLAMPFNSAFDGRYPFYDTNADASFAELGQYVKPFTVLITRLLAVELAGARRPFICTRRRRLSLRNHAATHAERDAL